VTHIAQMNWGRLLYDWEDPRVAEFVDNLDLVNGIAARAPGYVWHMPEAAMDTAQRDVGGVFGGDARIASTLSVWESFTALSDFVFKTIHANFMAKARLWQEKQAEVTYVIWPVSAGHRPDMIEAKARLDLLAENGPNEVAFDFAYGRARGL